MTARVKALFLSLVLMIALVPAITLAETNATLATVSFKEGDLSIITDPKGSGLDFDFGEHFLPSSAVSYPSENLENHIFQIEDTRLNTGNWRTTVAMTSFTEASGSLIPPAIDAVIRLQNPRVFNENASAGTTGITASDDISVASNGAPQLLMEADATLNRGVYGMEWTPENVTLNISDSQVFLLELEAYSAIVTWSLVVGP